MHAPFSMIGADYSFIQNDPFDWIQILFLKNTDKYLHQDAEAHWTVSNVTIVSEEGMRNILHNTNKVQW